MGIIIEKLERLKTECSRPECELIEKMINSAADYVRQVVIMECVAANFAGRENEEYRIKLNSEDSTRTGFHEGLMTAVNIVNRICGMHNLPPIYEGSSARREYGDFAIALVDEIFNGRM